MNKLVFDGVVYDLDDKFSFRDAISCGAVIVEEVKTEQEYHVIYKTFNDVVVCGYADFVDCGEISYEVERVGIYLNEKGKKELKDYAEYLSKLWCEDAKEVILGMIQAGSFENKEYYDNEDDLHKQIKYFEFI